MLLIKADNASVLPNFSMEQQEFMSENPLKAENLTKEEHSSILAGYLEGKKHKKIRESVFYGNTSTLFANDKWLDVNACNHNPEDQEEASKRCNLLQCQVKPDQCYCLNLIVINKNVPPIYVIIEIVTYPALEKATMQKDSYEFNLVSTCEIIRLNLNGKNVEKSEFETKTGRKPSTISKSIEFNSNLDIHQQNEIEQDDVFNNPIELEAHEAALCIIVFKLALIPTFLMYLAVFLLKYIGLVSDQTVYYAQVVLLFAVVILIGMICGLCIDTVNL
ncbi:hypothetical protein ECANGB1_1243 [Enterospora canceri]|uniref:Uncharacterized protein n=1 Tax=Enterospora canceri TaxID=1081671 RepID=A0A1Y1S768_9MICR|nr:hypothetical protein ECANGB1_1243 [Enterospora canceri]